MPAHHASPSSGSARSTACSRSSSIASSSRAADDAAQQEEAGFGEEVRGIPGPLTEPEPLVEVERGAVAGLQGEVAGPVHAAAVEDGAQHRVPPAEEIVGGRVAVGARADHESERGSPLGDEVGERVPIEANLRRRVTARHRLERVAGSPERPHLTVDRDRQRLQTQALGVVGGTRAVRGDGPLPCPGPERGGIDGIGRARRSRPSVDARATRHGAPPRDRGWPSSARKRSAASSRISRSVVSARDSSREQADVLRHDRADVVGDRRERAQPREDLEGEAPAAAALQGVAEHRAVDPERCAERHGIVRQREVRGDEGVVHELGAQAGSECTHVEHRVPVGPEHRMRACHCVVGAADVDGQPALRRGRPTTTHGRIEDLHAVRLGRGCELLALLDPDRRMDQQHAARRHAREHTLGTEGDVAHRGTVGHADPDDVARTSERNRLVRDLRPVAERLEARGPSGPERRGQALVDHPLRHPGALAPEPDEPDRRHRGILPPIAHPLRRTLVVMHGGRPYTRRRNGFRTWRGSDHNSEASEPRAHPAGCSRERDAAGRHARRGPGRRDHDHNDTAEQQRARRVRRTEGRRALPGQPGVRRQRAAPAARRTRGARASVPHC